LETWAEGLVSKLTDGVGHKVYDMGLHLPGAAQGQRKPVLKRHPRFQKLVRIVGKFSARAFSDARNKVGTMGNGNMERLLVWSSPAHSADMERNAEFGVTQLEETNPNVAQEIRELAGIICRNLRLPHMPDEAELTRTLANATRGKVHMDGFLPFAGLMVDVTVTRGENEQRVRLTDFVVLDHKWKGWNGKKGWSDNVPDCDWDSMTHTAQRSYGPGTVTIFDTQFPHSQPIGDGSDRFCLALFWRLAKGPGDTFTDEVVVTQDIWRGRDKSLPGLH